MSCMRGDEFEPGDRVTVTGGYEGEASAWLQGRSGHTGKILHLAGSIAVVELDAPLTLDGSWQDFGSGAAKAIRTVTHAEGRWLALIQGWVGGRWANPTGRLHVGLCATPPAIETIPPGGGAGCWIESHAHMTSIPETVITDEDVFAIRDADRR